MKNTRKVSRCISHYLFYWSREIPSLGRKKAKTKIYLLYLRKDITSFHKFKLYSYYRSPYGIQSITFEVTGIFIHLIYLLYSLYPFIVRGITYIFQLVLMCCYTQQLFYGNLLSKSIILWYILRIKLTIGVFSYLSNQFSIIHSTQGEIRVVHNPKQFLIKGLFNSTLVEVFQ